MDSELNNEGYDLIRSDRNSHSGCAGCYIKKERHYNIIIIITLFIIGFIPLYFMYNVNKI